MRNFKVVQNCKLKTLHFFVQIFIGNITLDVVGVEAP
jgi:hypothetical protein